MKLNIEQAKQTAESTIKDNLRHVDYARTVMLADLYRKIITGDNVDSLLIQFNPRETLAAFEQRKRITKITTPAICSSVMNPFYKVPRTDRVVKKIIPMKKTDKNVVMDIQRKMDLFYGSDNEEGGLEYWLKNRFPELSFMDPNSFIVIEFDEFDPLETTPNAYPFEVSAEMAINFDIENNNVDWLIAMADITYFNTAAKGVLSDPQAGKKYIVYCGDFSLRYRQISKNKTAQNLDLQDNEYVQAVGDKYFAVSVYDTKLPDWQMFRTGYMRDLLTNGRTFVSPLHPALCHFESGIKDVSEFQLTKSTHVFPQKMAYVSPCAGEMTPEGVDLGCIHGRTKAGNRCGLCGGSGAKIHTSSQDVITFPLPESKDEMFPLKDMMAYFAPPIELLDFQAKQVDKIEPLVHQAVFNSTVLVKTTFVATATEKEQDMDSVYDTLTKYANKSSAVYLNIANAIAYLLDYAERVTFVYRYPSDFKMKNRQILYTEIKTINDSGAPSFVKESVEDDLANQVYIDDPEGLLKYTVEKKLLPFAGKTEDQITLAINSALVPDTHKILYLNFKEIILELVEEDANFYMLKPAEQKKRVEAVVLRYKTEMAPAQPSFNVKPVEEEEEVIEPNPAD